jgi:hypothetical protein
MDSRPTRALCRRRIVFSISSQPIRRRHRRACASPITRTRRFSARCRAINIRRYGGTQPRVVRTGGGYRRRSRGVHADTDRASSRTGSEPRFAALAPAPRHQSPASPCRHRRSRALLLLRARAPRSRSSFLDGRRKSPYRSCRASIDWLTLLPIGLDGASAAAVALSEEPGCRSEQADADRLSGQCVAADRRRGAESRNRAELSAITSATKAIEPQLSPQLTCQAWHRVASRLARRTRRCTPADHAYPPWHSPVRTSARRQSLRRCARDVVAAKRALGVTTTFALVCRLMWPRTLGWLIADLARNEFAERQPRRRKAGALKPPTGSAAIARY